MDWLQLSIYAARGLIYFIFFLIGITCFSFLNVVIYRLPINMKFTIGHSKCTSCGHKLAPKDLVPIVSWISLKGKCRYCGEKISARYTWVELLGGALAVFCTAYCGINLRALTVFLVLAVLTVITFIDIDCMEIPFVLNVTLFILGVVSIFTMNDVTIIERVIGMLCVSVPLYLIILVIPDGFGGGDIKLMFAAGFLLGWKATLMAFFIGLLIGGGYAIVLLARRKKGKKEHFAFGPFLSVGIAISMFVGNYLVDWYINIVKAAFYN